MNGPVPLSRRNIVALDGLRGLAILAVMCNHLSPPEPGGPLRQMARLGLTHGWAGVDLFFVLSGFLITGILLDTRECTNYFRSFYSRRALRIFPLYYSFLLLAWLVFPSTVRSDWLPLRADWWLYPCYLMNWQALWKGFWHANIVGHFWSLCVEEQFYFLWPLVVLVLRPRWLLRALACAEIAVLAGRWWWVFHFGPSGMLYTATITRMDGLLFGAGCAVVVRQFRFPRWAVAAMPWLSALCLAAYLAVVQFGDPRREDSVNQTGGLPLLAVGFAAILLYAVLTDGEPTWLQTWLRWKPLTRVGKYAYGIYVFHVPLFYFLSESVQRLPEATRTAAWVRYPTIALKFSLAFGIASLSYNFFEKRFLALKGRFEPEYGTAASPPGVAIG
jgi:peptidoglycan/LPS O-acetylase OafA/YrhL